MEVSHVKSEIHGFLGAEGKGPWYFKSGGLGLECKQPDLANVPAQAANE